MQRWAGKVAVVTGASSGIGVAVVQDLIKAGMIVAGLARRVERVEAIKQDIPTDATGKLYAVKCDLTQDDDITRAFNWIEKELGTIDVLVNNAGLVKPGPLFEEGNEDALKEVLQTNLWGLVLCSKRAVEIMRRTNVVGAHVININSVVGHTIPVPVGRAPMVNVYPSSKYGVTAITEVLRQEFNFAKANFKVTSISPGVVRTELFSEKMYELYPGCCIQMIFHKLFYMLWPHRHMFKLLNLL